MSASCLTCEVPVMGQGFPVVIQTSTESPTPVILRGKICGNCFIRFNFEGHTHGKYETKDTWKYTVDDDLNSDEEE